MVPSLLGTVVRTLLTVYAVGLLIENYHSRWDLKAVVNRCGVIAGPWQFGTVDQGWLSLWELAHHCGRPQPPVSTYNLATKARCMADSIRHRGSRETVYADSIHCVLYGSLNESEGDRLRSEAIAAILEEEWDLERKATSTEREAMQEDPRVSENFPKQAGCRPRHVAAPSCAPFGL
jgi:hypothetical protein